MGFSNGLVLSFCVAHHVQYTGFCDDQVIIHGFALDGSSNGAPIAFRILGGICSLLRLFCNLWSPLL